MQQAVVSCMCCGVYSTVEHWPGGQTEVACILPDLQQLSLHHDNAAVQPNCQTDVL